MVLKYVRCTSVAGGVYAGAILEMFRWKEKGSLFQLHEVYICGCGCENDLQTETSKGTIESHPVRDICATYGKVH